MAGNKYNIGFNKFKNIYGDLDIRVLQEVNETSPDIIRYIVEFAVEKFIAERNWILNQEK